MQRAQELHEASTDPEIQARAEDIYSRINRGVLPPAEADALLDQLERDSKSPSQGQSPAPQPKEPTNEVRQEEGQGREGAAEAVPEKMPENAPAPEAGPLNRRRRKPASTTSTPIVSSGPLRSTTSCLRTFAKRMSSKPERPVHGQGHEGQPKKRGFSEMADAAAATLDRVAESARERMRAGTPRGDVLRQSFLAPEFYASMRDVAIVAAAR